MSKQKQDTKQKQNKQYGTLIEVPDGMTTRLGPNDQPFLVPQYMIPALDHAFASFRKKGDVGALEAKPLVSDGAAGTDAFPESRECRTCRAVPASRQLYLFIISLPYMFHDS